SAAAESCPIPDEAPDTGTVPRKIEAEPTAYKGLLALMDERIRFHLMRTGRHFCRGTSWPGGRAAQILQAAPWSLCSPVTLPRIPAWRCGRGWPPSAPGRGRGPLRWWRRGRHNGTGRGFGACRCRREGG